LAITPVEVDPDAEAKQQAEVVAAQSNIISTATGKPAGPKPTMKDLEF